MDIKILKTFEISDELWEKIAEGFRESFDIDTSSDRLKNAFCIRNRLGYGFHAVAMTEDGDVAGYNVYSPTLYKGELKIVVSGSTFVRPKYRKNNEFLFLDMINALRKEVKNEGYKIEVGVPNHNSRNFSEKILKSRYVADLNYYILPNRISRCLNKSNLKFLDPIVSRTILFHLWFQSKLTLLFDKKEKRVKYEMLSGEADLKARFKGPYKQLTEGTIQAYYRIVDEDGKKAVYLMDFRDNGVRTARSLNYAVRTIVKNEKPDAVLFVGWLRLKQCSLFKVPQSKVPKPLPLVYYILDKEHKELYSDMDNVDNWNFSLMNFDVR